MCKKERWILPLLLLCLLLAGCVPTQSEIDAAYKNGYDKGFTEGHILGVKSAGETQYQRGYDAGHAKGYDEGFADGANSLFPSPEYRYVANQNTMKFHLPTCGSVNDILPSNRLNWSGTRDELIAKGYEPCARCNP